MNPKTFAMITDFGFDFSVASMKALILKEFPNAQIIDVDHSIKQFSILSGAFVIDKIYSYFPEGTIFICVVDPGVGGKREPVCIDTGRYIFIGPNNGLFHYILEDRGPSFKSYAIKEEFRAERSTTFHGRDLFTPAAIEIAKGNFDIVNHIDKEKLIRIDALTNGILMITYIDGFGNIKTNLPFPKNFTNKTHIKLNLNGSAHSIQVATTFSEVNSGGLLCYKGSNNTLEIAANLASAGTILDANVGDSIEIIEQEL